MTDNIESFRAVKPEPTNNIDLPPICGGFSDDNEEYWLQPEIEAILTEWHDRQREIDDAAEDDRIRQQIRRDYTHPVFVRHGRCYYPRIASIGRNSKHLHNATFGTDEAWRANYFAPTPGEFEDALNEVIVPPDPDPDCAYFDDPDNFEQPPLDDDDPWEWTHHPDFPAYRWVLAPKGITLSDYIGRDDEMVVLNLNAYKSGIKASTESIAKIPAVPWPTDPLERLTHCGGLVGDVVDWIEATAIRPNRVLAFGAALTVIGTLLGRRVRGPTESATHLYVLGLARTGAGKQHPISCAKKLLDAAGAGDLIGPSDFTSGSAVTNHLEEKPLSLCVQDEFGAFIKRINSKKASGWETQVSKIYRELWGLSFERFDGPRWAQRKSEVVYAPALSIFGMSTPKEFYESLQAGDLPNGFVNRFIVLSSDNKAPEQEPQRGPVPDAITRKVRTLFEWREGHRGRR